MLSTAPPLSPVIGLVIIAGQRGGEDSHRPGPSMPVFGRPPDCRYVFFSNVYILQYLLTCPKRIRYIQPLGVAPEGVPGYDAPVQVLSSSLLTMMGRRENFHLSPISCCGVMFASPCAWRVGRCMGWAVGPPPPHHSKTFGRRGGLQAGRLHGLRSARAPTQTGRSSREGR